MKSALFLIIFIAAAISAVPAQVPVKWTLTVSDAERRLDPGENETAVLSAVIDGGWRLYAHDQPDGGPIATRIRITEATPFAIDGAITSGKPDIKADTLFKDAQGKPLETRSFKEKAEFKVPVTAVSAARLGDLSLDVRFQLCNDTVCLPPTTKRITLNGTEDVNRSSAKTAAEMPKVQNAGTESAPDDNIWSFIWLAASLGALSLLTPCVFPMVPITVSYFTHHSAGSRSKAVRSAAVYSIGIIATFTLLGMLLAIFIGAAGINLFAANPWINLLITAIFLFFAFNLFGAYEIGIPSSVLSRLDALTRSSEGEGRSVAGALLMGLTFTLTSFTCTSPFVGTVLVSASHGNWQMPLVGMLAFSTVFALPFFVLALAPQLVSQLPRAGSWMNSVKVTMGFLEIAAAMKFLSNVDLVWKWGIFTRPVVLAVWIAIAIILSLYLLGKFQLSHDSKPERIGVFRLAAAIVSLAVGFYLLTGLFGRTLGELEAFLPPEVNGISQKTQDTTSQDGAWVINDHEKALAKAKSENKNVFIDFTGYTCTNCRWMEANVFPKAEVAAEMNKFVLSRLYTDGDGEVYQRQQKMEQDMFGTVALPLYAIISPDGKVIASFPGLTRNTDEFVSFLRSGQKN